MGARGGGGSRGGRFNASSSSSVGSSFASRHAHWNNYNGCLSLSICPLSLSMALSCRPRVECTLGKAVQSQLTPAGTRTRPATYAMDIYLCVRTSKRMVESNHPWMPGKPCQRTSRPRGTRPIHPTHPSGLPLWVVLCPRGRLLLMLAAGPVSMVAPDRFSPAVPTLATQNMAHDTLCTYGEASFVLFPSLPCSRRKKAGAPAPAARRASGLGPWGTETVQLPPFTGGYRVPGRG